MSVTLEVGKTEELTFAVLPEQAVQKVLWESSNEKIVTVKEGKVTAIAAGEAEVKAVVAENKSLTAVCKVTVTDPVPEEKPVTGLMPTPADESVSLTVGETQTFSVAVVPEDASNPAVNWSVDNEAVRLSATTGTSVTVTAASAGKAVVTAVSADNSEVAVSWTVTVTAPVPEEKPVTGLTPTPAVGQTVSLTVGGTQTFSVAVVPEDASNPAVNWSVDNGAVTLSAATGTSVTVTAASAGKAVVTAVSADNSEVFVSWTVTVTESVAEPTELDLAADVPDEAFRAILREFDTDSDGKISKEEAEQVTELNLEWNYESTQIQNLQGIAFFSEIEILNAAYQKLQTVDLSGNKKLKRVNLEFNYIRELDLSNQTELISSETSGSATYYGLQVGYQKENESDSEGNASITVTLPSSKKSLWNETWSKNKVNGFPVNQGVIATFR